MTGAAANTFDSPLKHRKQTLTIGMTGHAQLISKHTLEEVMQQQPVLKQRWKPIGMIGEVAVGRIRARTVLRVTGEKQKGPLTEEVEKESLGPILQVVVTQTVATIWQVVVVVTVQTASRESDNSLLEALLSSEFLTVVLVR